MSEDEIRRAWFLDPSERGNASTAIDRRRGDGLAWSVGNRVELLVHGRPYFERLHAALCDTKEGDSVSFTDWRGDPDRTTRRVDGSGSHARATSRPGA